jgi:serine/threonine-protein kinase
MFGFAQAFARRPRFVRLNGRHYRLLGKPARGGQSLLCAAVRDDGQRVALKRAASVFDDEGSALLANEYLRLDSLRHRAIVAAIDFGRDDASGDCCLVLEYVDGEPLHLAVQSFGEHDAARVFLDLLQACRALARRRLAHCDIKPDNILVVRGGSAGPSVKLVDFGVATPHGEPMTGMSTSFVAPEHLFSGADEDGGAPAGPGTDLHALGVTWYWLLTGRHPYFPDGHPVVLQPCAYARTPPAPSALNPTLDRRWDACLLGLIDRDPRRRLATAQRIVKQRRTLLPLTAACRQAA